jgi:hypothetical protein
MRGVTGNISANGVFLWVPLRLDLQTVIDFTVILRDSTSGRIELQGQGRVVRGSQPGEMPGFAATIDEYTLFSAGSA